MRYILGDPHFYHDKMVRLRGYNSKKQMNNNIINKINSIVNNKYDTIIINGDVSFANKELTNKIISKMNGYKILVMGNHDRRHSKKWWHDVGFNDVVEDMLLIDNIIVSHEPVDYLPVFYKNIHAHTHDKKYVHLDGNKHYCTSIEIINKPVLLNKVISKLKEENDEI